MTRKLSPVVPVLSREFFVRQAIVFAACLFPGTVLVWQGFRRDIPLLSLFGVFPLFLWAFLIWREYRRGPSVMDLEGITRRDGQRFLWKDFREQRRVRGVLQYGAPGALSYIEIVFSTGSVRVFPYTFDNGGDVMRFVEAHNPPPKEQKCSSCGDLGDYHHAMQKHGRENEDTHLPPQAANLVTVKDIHPGKTRSPSLERCPGCGTYYLYEVTYEYLATGSEDEQMLTRLSPEEAAKYL